MVRDVEPRRPWAICAARQIHAQLHHRSAHRSTCATPFRSGEVRSSASRLFAQSERCASRVAAPRLSRDGVPPCLCRNTAAARRTSPDGRPGAVRAGRDRPGPMTAVSGDRAARVPARPVRLPSGSGRRIPLRFSPSVSSTLEAQSWARMPLPDPLSAGRSAACCWRWSSASSVRPPHWSRHRPHRPPRTRSAPRRRRAAATSAPPSPRAGWATRRTRASRAVSSTR